MVAVIAGPTASGKSGLAMALAERLNGTIVNADASQLYADLRVLSARPDEADEARVPHRLYGVLDGGEVATAASWAELARATIADIHAEGRLPILVGGNGLYIQALLGGLAPVPEIPEEVRERVRAMGTAEAAVALAAEDPLMAARLADSDRSRLLRALEVIRASGRSLSAWQSDSVTGLADSHAVRGMVLMPPRPQLHAAAALRIEAMLAGGAVAEVERLLARELPADRPVLKAIGVPQIADYIAGKSTKAAMSDAILFQTRKYQKRQTTWIRRRMVEWLQLPTPDIMISLKFMSAPSLLHKKFHKITIAARASLK